MERVAHSSAVGSVDLAYRSASHLSSYAQQAVRHPRLCCGKSEPRDILVRGGRPRPPRLRGSRRTRTYADHNAQQAVRRPRIDKASQNYYPYFMAEAEDRTFIGIDYGTRRIGLAKSDPTGIIASALMTLEVSSGRDAADKISGIIEEYQPCGVVFGYPLSLSGEKSGKCREIDRFIKRLARIYTGPIHRVDERLSTLEAQRVLHAHGKKVGQDKKRLDRLAAVIILQRFLDGLPRSEKCS